jgi:hypothetical protein
MVIFLSVRVENIDLPDLSKSLMIVSKSNRATKPTKYNKMVKLSEKNNHIYIVFKYRTTTRYQA